MANTPAFGSDWPPVVKHALVVVVLMAVAALVFLVSVSFASTTVSSTFNDLIPQARRAICTDLASGTGQAVVTVKPIVPNLANYPASDAEKQRIAVQVLKAQRLQCLHMSLFDMYARNYYGSIVASMVFGGIAAIALFLVGPKGWSTSNAYLVNVMVTAAAITAFFGAFPGVFQQASSVAAHKGQILRYEALLDGMASHTAAPKLVPAICMNQSTAPLKEREDTPFPPVAFIACNDAALANADVVFGFDLKSQPDYQKALGWTAGK